jgi:hypothetical protein
MTKKEINDKKSKNGGWSKKQFAEWGIPWPPPKGWKQMLLNKKNFKF